MRYKVFIFCPNDQKVIDKLINAASAAGAGIIGNYTQVAFVSRGTGQWKAGEGAYPTIGKIGELTHQEEAKIEIICDESVKTAVYEAVKKAHPYEEPSTEFIKLEE